jgi:uncharacterized protein Yka (UPF0111/DUF47 family)
MLQQLSDVLQAASGLLVEALEHSAPGERQSYYHLIKEKEREGDAITHRIFDELGTTFITPFDREDIHRLASHIDDVIDEINSSVKRIALYNPRPIGEAGKELARLIDEEAKLICLAMGELERFRKNPAPLLEHCIRLHDIENRADDIYEEFTIRLFKYETDFVEIIKIKEIMHELEKTTDVAEYVGKILRSFVVKYA